MSRKYVGLDVHKATSTAVVKTEAGRFVSKATVKTTAENLVMLVQSIPGEVHLTFEEGTYAAWLYDLLDPHVAKLVVCDPRRNKLLGDEDKNDDSDADCLAELLRGNLLKPVYHGEQSTRSLKELVTGYDLLVRDVVSVKNRIKAIFRGRGMGTSGSAVYSEDPGKRQVWLDKLTEDGLRQRAIWLYRQLDSLEELRREGQRKMLAEGRRHEATRWLETVPGIGPIRAAQLVGRMGTPHRFRTKRQLWKYSGLAVVRRSSSDYQEVNGKLCRRQKEITRGLNRHYNRRLKAIFKGAAIDASARGGFKDHYQSLLSDGIQPTMARLTIARKIAATCLAIWKRGERYDEGKAVIKRP